MKTLQRAKTSGGQGLPNIRLYHIAFSVRPIHTWLNPEARVAWRPIEAELVAPHRLQDVIYSNIPQKVYKNRFGPIISHLISMWNSLQSLSNTDLKFHAFLPLYNNYSLHHVVHRRIGLRLFSFPQWSEKGIDANEKSHNTEACLGLNPDMIASPISFNRISPIFPDIRRCHGTIFIGYEMCCQKVCGPCIREYFCLHI